MNDETTTTNEADADRRIAQMKEEMDRLVAEVRLAHVEATLRKLGAVMPERTRQ